MARSSHLEEFTLGGVRAAQAAMIAAVDMLARDRAGGRLRPLGRLWRWQFVVLETVIANPGRTVDLRLAFIEQCVELQRAFIERLFEAVEGREPQASDEGPVTGALVISLTERAATASHRSRHPRGGSR